MQHWPINKEERKKKGPNGTSISRTDIRLHPASMSDWNFVREGELRGSFKCSFSFPSCVQALIVTPFPFSACVCVLLLRSEKTFDGIFALCYASRTAQEKKKSNRTIKDVEINKPKKEGVPINA